MPHRDRLIQLLNAYAPDDELEKDFKERMLRFAHDYADCFERSCRPGHFTASAWLLSADGERALLMHHAKLDRWFQLGGHADGDPDLLAVAIKEAQEESGIETVEPISTQIFDIDIHAIPANAKDPTHFHYDLRFLLRAKGDDTVALNSESKELRWISKDPTELPTQARSVVRLFEKWTAGSFH